MNIKTNKKLHIIYYLKFVILSISIILAAFCFSSCKKELVEVPTKPTIKEFLSHSIEPLGTTLYIFGGGWDYDENTGDEYSKSIGVSPTWKEFFESQNEWFVYKNSKKKNTSYFPFDGKNKHHEKGLDCTGFLGWLFYNTFEKEGSNKNYVYNTAKWLDTFTNDYNLGTKEVPEGTYLEKSKSMTPSDIVIIDGHAYIVIGRCDDDSIVILHSTVTNSITGAFGGGLQLSAINIHKSENKNCKAYNLADYYMSTYFPEWHRRYPTVVKPTEKYLRFNNNNCGIFHFTIPEVITDPENIKNMSADEILKLLFELL